VKSTATLVEPANGGVLSASRESSYNERGVGNLSTRIVKGTTMGWIIWGFVLPSCVVAAWLIVLNPLRQVLEELCVDQARLGFHQQREWLEARFLSALGKVDPIERLRWENAQWQDQVHWARDHQTRRLLALVEVQFEVNPYETSTEPLVSHATALFEYRKGRWFADGKRLDATHPDEVFQWMGRFEPVLRPHRRD
jgi:hypothetical protein